MKSRILIAGAGQLGQRYLQGLAASKDPFEIWVYDISLEALKRAAERWQQVNPKVAHCVNFATTIEGFPTLFDVVVVASTADVRADLVECISEVCNVRFWILEKVLAQSLSDLYRIEKCVEHGWVNTPRYEWGLYKRLRNRYPHAPAIQISYEGLDGLACNAIHFVDLVCRWGGAKLIDVDTSGLCSKWHEGKRRGFYEIEGNILMNFDDSSRLSLSSYRDSSCSSMQLKVEDKEWAINEMAGKAISVDGEVIEGGSLLQSQLTAPLIKSILLGASCNLPSLAESCQQHQIFLGSLMEHWNMHMPEKLIKLPIT